jgi:Ulp1 family protease
MNSILIRLNIFKGTIPADALESVIRWWGKWDGEKTKCFVLNTSPHNVPWGHWLLLSFFKGKKRIELFDSLGSPSLIPENIKTELRKVGTILITHSPIQKLNSNFCGIYVIARAQSIYRGESLKSFYLKFNLNNLEQNDTNCLKMVLKDMS